MKSIQTSLPPVYSKSGGIFFLINTSRMLGPSWIRPPSHSSAASVFIFSSQAG